jgi:hypothetical protein
MPNPMRQLIVRGMKACVISSVGNHIVNEYDLIVPNMKFSLDRARRAILLSDERLFLPR